MRMNAEECSWPKEQPVIKAKGSRMPGWPVQGMARSPEGWSKLRKGTGSRE